MSTERGSARRLSAFLSCLVLASTACPSASAAQRAPDGQPATARVEAGGRVVRGVVVRARPTAGSPAVGRLPPGGSAELVAALPGWYRVRLADGTQGFVSRRWTDVAPAPVPAPGSDDRFLVEAVDVGTGLAILVTGPDFTLLYDGGSNDDDALGAGNRLLAFLRRARPDLRRIDHLVLSHPHTDHVSLLPDVLDAYDFGEVWDSGRVNGICGYRAFLERVAARTGVVYHSAIGIGPVHRAGFKEMTCRGARLAPTVVELAAGPVIGRDAVPLGRGATMRFLHADGAAYAEVNRNSLVVALDLGGRRVLLMGDAEAGGRADPSVGPKARSIEGRLLACCRSDLRADVLVAGHHGSETSSRRVFLDAVGARTFVVSSGPTRYSGVRLPDAAVVGELGRRGAVWRTDFDDAACALADKVGPDRDGAAGGCDNVRLETGPAGVVASYDRMVD